VECRPAAVRAIARDATNTSLTEGQRREDHDHQSHRESTHTYSGETISNPIQQVACSIGDVLDLAAICGFCPLLSVSCPSRPSCDAQEPAYNMQETNDFHCAAVAPCTAVPAISAWWRFGDACTSCPHSARTGCDHSGIGRPLDDRPPIRKQRHLIWLVPEFQHESLLRTLPCGFSRSFSSPKSTVRCRS